MIEFWWIAAPFFLLISSLTFTVVYWPAFWPNRRDGIAQNLIALSLVFAVYAAGIVWFRLTDMGEREVRIIFDILVGVVIAWRTFQVYNILHNESD